MTANTYSKANVVDLSLTSEEQFYCWTANADANSTLTLPARTGKVPIMLSGLNLDDGTHVTVACVTSTRVVTIDSGGAGEFDNLYSFMWTYKSI